MQALEQRDIGEETTKKLRAVLISPQKRMEMELELALCLDIEPLVRTTYDLEGDGLTSLLAYRKLESLRIMGRNLNQQITLPNTAALLRKTCPLLAGG